MDFLVAARSRCVFRGWNLPRTDIPKSLDGKYKPFKFINETLFPGDVEAVDEWFLIFVSEKVRLLRIQVFGRLVATFRFLRMPIRLRDRPPPRP